MMESDMKENLLMIKGMEKGLLSGLMEELMKDFGRMENKMEKVNLQLLMGRLSTAFGIRVREKPGQMRREIQ
jgi:hypothetical protein